MKRGVLRVLALCVVAYFAGYWVAHQAAPVLAAGPSDAERARSALEAFARVEDPALQERLEVCTSHLIHQVSQSNLILPSDALEALRALKGEGQ